MRRLLASLLFLCFSLVPFAMAAAQAPATSGPPLWRVERNGHVLWLLGTLSPVGEDMAVSSPRIEQAIAASSELVLPPEVVYAAEAGMFSSGLVLPEMLDARRNPGGAMLEEVVPADLYRRWQDAKARHIGRDGGVEKLRPAFAALALYEEARRDADLETGRVEEAVLELAADARLRITRTDLRVPIQDPDATLDALRAARDADLQCLGVALDRIDADLAAMQRRAAAWTAGDVAALQRIGLDDQERACRESITRPPLLRERSGRDFESEGRDLWLDAVDAALQGNTNSFAMVPLHDLLGDDGYLAALAARGYVVEAPTP
jgi:uncharacterized protein YbaP (TraB family)